ncbi:phage tail family protein [Loigolactobacillus bifermentans]|nr:phage tail family protein [Loigolactobacillus bifermentans]
MIMGTVIVQRSDGITYDLNKLGMRVIQFEPPSANYQHTSEAIGTYGVVDTGTTVGALQIPFKLDVFAEDRYDVILQRRAFFEVFSSMDPFYIYDCRQLALRWKVKAEQQPFGFYDNFYMGGDISFNLICNDGYAETAATSLNAFDGSNTGWGFGMGLPDNVALPYSWHNQATFKVLNPSSIPLLAEERPVHITFKGKASKLTIENTTTSQTFVYNAAIDDTFELFGAWPLLNNTPDFANGNHAMIDLAKGWNTFKLSGYQGDCDVSIDTRFYYNG